MDFGSTAIDVAIGVSFVFFLLSLIVTAGTEAASWIFKRRAATLEQGVQGLLRDEATAAAVLRHPLVKVKKGDKPRRPSYVSSRNFFLALIDAITSPGSRKSTPATLAEIRTGIEEIEDDALRKQLNALLAEADEDLETFRANVEDWFDDAMDRVSGVYRRWAQLVAIGLGFFVACAMNADALRITNRLANNESVRAAVVKAAENALAKKPEKPKTTANSSRGTRPRGDREGAGGGRPGDRGNAGRNRGGRRTNRGGRGNRGRRANRGGRGNRGRRANRGGRSGAGRATSTPRRPTQPAVRRPGPLAAGERAQRALNRLKSLEIPIGWSDSNKPDWPSTAFGWLITAVAISLGAPFWFDALSKISRLRTTGARPGPDRRPQRPEREPIRRDPIRGPRRRP